MYVESIILKCLFDHSGYIASYANDSRKNIFPKRHKMYDQQYRHLQRVLKELTSTYPQIMGFLIDANTSNVSEHDIITTITSQTGGAIEIDKAKKVLDKIKEKFGEFREILLNKGDVHNNALKIQGELKKIEQQITTIGLSAQNSIDTIKINPSAVLNNLQQVATNIQLDQSIGAKNVLGNLRHTINEIIVPLEKNVEFNEVLGVTLTNFVLSLVANDPISEELMSDIKLVVSDTPDVLRTKFNIQANGNDIDVQKIATISIQNRIKDGKLRFKSDIDQNDLLQKMQKGNEIISLIKKNTTITNTNAIALEKNIQDMRLYIKNEHTLYNTTFVKIKAHFIPSVRMANFYFTALSSGQNEPYMSKLISLYNELPISDASIIQNIYGTLKVICDSDDPATIATKIKDKSFKKAINIYMEKVNGNDLSKMNEFLRYVNNLMEDNTTIRDNAMHLYVNKITTIIKTYAEKFQNYGATMSNPDCKLNMTINFTTTDESPFFSDESISHLSDQMRQHEQMLRTICTIKLLSVNKKQTNLLESLHSFVKQKDNKQMIQQIQNFLGAFMHNFSACDVTPPVNYIDWVYKYNIAMHITLLKDPKERYDMLSEISKKNGTTLTYNDQLYNDAVHFDEIRAILGLPVFIPVLPSKFYISTYTKMIFNELFEFGTNALHSTAMLHDLVCEQVDTPEKIGSVLYNPDLSNVCTKSELRDQKSTFDPAIDFSMIKDTKSLLQKTPQTIITDTKSLLQETPQTTITEETGATSINQMDGLLTTDKPAQIAYLQKVISDICEHNIKYISAITEYNAIVKLYNMDYIDIYAFVRFLILVGTNQYFTSNYVLYEYINKGIIEFYRRIFDRIISDINEPNVSKPLMYIWKEYKVIILKMHNLFTLLSNVAQEPTTMIDINGIYDKEIRNEFTMFNHFKNIIDSYNELFQNKLTVYARINDIKNEIDYDAKIFVSDYERTLNTDQNVISSSSLMWFDNRSCKAIEKKEDPFKLKFTEVYDSIKFQDNGDISKYMTLETQLAKQKGICIMTYGYSGTGKTYTLFGNKDKYGMLQSTLANINGLHQVKFRLFEIYGIGFPYSFYWTDENKAPRTNYINHQIFHYKLATNANSIIIDTQESDITIYDGSKFKQYIDNDDTYITVGLHNMKTIFGNFSDFTNTVDEYRKGNKGNTDGVKYIRRIRDTPNNKESSRSILVYDFKLYINGNEDINSVNFLIIDLPGRETIEGTYIVPYIEKDVIHDILELPPIQIANAPIVKKTKSLKIKSTVNGEQTTLDPELGLEKELKLKMTLTCMALNPIALAVFYFDIILTEVSKPNVDIDPLFANKMYREIIWDKISNQYLGWLLSDDFPFSTALKITDKITTHLSGQEYEIPNTVKVALHGDPSETKYYDGIHVAFKRLITSHNLNEQTIAKHNGRGYEKHIASIKVKQVKATVAIFVMHYLIKNNKMRVIDEIFKSIINKEINNPIKDKLNKMTKPTDLLRLIGNIKRSQFKVDLLYDSSISNRLTECNVILNDIDDSGANTPRVKTDNVVDVNKLRGVCFDLLKYDYITTPLEGMYINENIMGLIKYLADKLLSDSPGKRDLSILKPGKDGAEQPEITLEYQRNIARTWIMTDTSVFLWGDKLKKTLEILGIDRISDYDTRYFDERIDQSNNLYYSMYKISGNDLKLNVNRLENCRKEIIKQYNPGKIYNFQKPLLTDILSRYVKEGKDKINDFKMFYLFGNYDENDKTQFKCKPQFELLKETQDFINTIAQ